MIYFMIIKLNYPQRKSSLRKFSYDEYCVWGCYTVQTCSATLDHIRSRNLLANITDTSSHMQQHYLQNFKTF
jgi:hypothetical protein